MQPSCNPNNYCYTRIHSNNNVVWHRLGPCLSASKPKYTFDFSEEEEADEEENGDDDVASSPVRSFKDDFTSSETKERYNDHNDDDDDDDNEVSYSPPKQKPT